MNFCKPKYILLSTLILIFTGCQSGPKNNAPQTNPDIQRAPIEMKSIPASASQTLLPGAQQSTTRVAMILPLTGTHARLGTSMLNAAQLSLFEHAPDHLELISEDSEGTPEGAVRAAQKAIQNGAAIILGPIFSQEAQAVAAVSGPVPVLSFSNNRDIASANLFVLGFMPDQQIQRLFESARAKGITKIAILASSNEAGKTMSAQAEQVARSVGVELISIPSYASGSYDMQAQAKSILQNKVQAVLIPEGGQPLRLMVSSLISHGINPHHVKFMGSGQWDNPSVFADKNLVGAWFASSSSSLRQGFNKKYVNTYGQPAPRLATLAYDSISMLSYLAKTKDPAQAFSLSSLLESRGFEGVDGIFKFNGDGTVIRGLVVYEITETNELKEISPAPQVF
ncbi:MAG: penicillin-binding protein activator [Alphaproteobacteria bacterium]|nr:penicillin-binding protein activator [Alphaproteobacteria bacterium]